MTARAERIGAMERAEPSSFGELLRRYRTAAGLTQEELAARAGLSARGVQDLERGLRRSPHPDTIRRLAEALGLQDAERTQLLGAVGRAGSSSGGSPVVSRPVAALPIPLTSFVGRETELAEIQRLLSSVRLLTLVGAGGVGKTRLAMEGARRLAGEYAEGAWLVELAALTDPGLVPQAVADVVGVREQPGRALQGTLVASLQQRHLLLVLDNCEHVIDACAELASELLGVCPRVRIMATSREPLRIVGEQVWPVLPLAAPPPGQAPGVDELGRFPAVRLFVQRAQAAQPDFALTVENSAAVSSICSGLDGLPLAIELAAAKVTVLTPAQIGARLSDRFRLLVRGSRIGPARHRRLDTAIEWTYALLTPAEQRLFEDLSVFAGGWTLEAAEAVGVTHGGADLDVLDLLTGLVSKSVIAVERPNDAQVRYSILETLRLYGQKQLASRGREPNACARHAAYFLSLAEHARTEIEGPRARFWVERMEEEQDNLRAAWRWAIDGNLKDLQLGLAANCWKAQWMLGHLAEPLNMLEVALLKPVEQPRSEHAIALQGAGFLAALCRGDVAGATARISASVEEFRAVGDARGLGLALGDAGLGHALIGEDNAAQTLLSEALTVGKNACDDLVVGYALFRHGQAALFSGEAGLAVQLLEAAVAAGRLADRPHLVVQALSNLICAVAGHGMGSRATELAHECLPLAVELNDAWALTAAVHALAIAAEAQSEHERAARLFGAADAMRLTQGAAVTPVLQRAAQHGMSASRLNLGDVGFEAAFTYGRALTPAETVRFALER